MRRGESIRAVVEFYPGEAPWRPTCSMPPGLHRGDLAQALHFYRDQLGFIVHWQWGSPAVRAGVMRDGIELHLHVAEADETPGGGAIYVHMTGIEALLRAVPEAGTLMTRPLETRPWGVVDFAVRGPRRQPHRLRAAPVSASRQRSQTLPR